MENSKEIRAIVEKANKILLHLHPGPDLDSMGSALGMAWAIKQLGKNPTVIRGDSELPDFAPLFPGYEEILPKNFFEITLADYDLMIILDSGSPQMVSTQGEVRFPEDLNTIVIDHHKSNTAFGKINLVRPDYPANCQLLFDLFADWEIKLNRNIATCLFLGMYGDTGGFRYLGTSAQTFATVAKLVELIPDFSKIIFTLDNNRQPETLYYEALALNSIEVIFGKVAVSSVSFAEMASQGVRPEHVGAVGMSTKLKSVVGWDLGIAMHEIEPGIVKVSSRTRDPEKFDVSKLATALGGGGHRAAAGARIVGDIATAKAKLREILPKIYPVLAGEREN